MNHIFVYMPHSAVEWFTILCENFQYREKMFNIVRKFSTSWENFQNSEKIFKHIHTILYSIKEPLYKNIVFRNSAFLWSKIDVTDSLPHSLTQNIMISFVDHISVVVDRCGRCLQFCKCWNWCITANQIFIGICSTKCNNFKQEN